MTSTASQLVESQRNIRVPTWQTDLRASDKYLPEIKAICGRHLIGVAPMKEDQSRNTDLIVLGLNAVRIACRVRDMRYALNADYREQFTLRSVRFSGTQTELDKVIAGWGDFIFYGFGDLSGNLRKWFIGDLKIFRAYFSDYMRTNGGEMPGMYHQNGDSSSGFRAFFVDDLPTGFVVARG